MDKTVKTRAYTNGASDAASSSNLSEAQEAALELVKKTALLEEAKIKSLEYLNTIEHLQESLRLEQARSADLVKKISGMESRIKELSEQGGDLGRVVELETRVKELTDLLGRISGIAATGRMSQ
jgi:hypothetical protein